MRSTMTMALRAAAGRRVALAGVAAALVAAPALAQQQGNQQSGQMQRESQVGRSQQRQQGQMQQDPFGQEQPFGQRSRFEQQGQFGQQDPFGQRTGMGQQDRFPTGRPTSMGQQPGFVQDQENWVRVGYDFDNDGRFDSVGYIYIQDLEQARSMSERRMNTQGRGGQGFDQMGRQTDRFQRGFEPQGQRSGDQQFQQERQFQQDRFMRQQQGGFPDYRNQPGRTYQSEFDQRQWEQQQRFQQPRNQQQRFQQQERMWDDYGPSARGMQQGGTLQLRGEIQRLTPVQLRGEQDRHVLATVRTDRGQIARVNLGPEQQVRRLNLQEGDQVMLSGTRATINDRPVLMATRINTGDQGQSGIMQTGMGLQGQVQGQVIRTWEGELQHDDTEHTLALVRLNQGQTMIVDLGPTDDIDDLDIEQGDRISLTGRQGSIDGQPALLAKSVSTQDDSVDIKLDENRTDLRTRDGLPRQMMPSGGQQGERWDDRSSQRDPMDR